MMQKKGRRVVHVSVLKAGGSNEYFIQESLVMPSKEIITLVPLGREYNCGKGRFRVG